MNQWAVSPAGIPMWNPFIEDSNSIVALSVSIFSWDISFAYFISYVFK
jgi:tetrahydromethanopterin S-methyltransferase subunit C